MTDMPTLAQYKDAWQNCLTGMGTLVDKSQHTTFKAGPEQQEQVLTDLYRHTWLTRRLVEAVPGRALARGFSEKTPMPPQFEDLNYAKWDEGALMRAIIFGRLLGGAHLFIGYADGGADLSKPVTRKGNVAFLDVMTRYELRPARAGSVEARDRNPASPRAGQVEVWEVTGAEHPRRGMKYHWSRAIQFGGLSRPPNTRQGLGSLYTTQDKDWTDSVLTPCITDVERFGVTWQSISQLLHVASIGVLKLGNLINSLAVNQSAVMKARIDIMNQCLALTRNLMLDSSANEDFSRTAVSFADIPALLDQLMIVTSAAFKQPATELFGRSPAGMNATGEGDRIMYYADVGEYRQRVIRPRVNALAEAISGTPQKIEYPEIHQPTDTEKAELRTAWLAGDERLWTMGAVSDQEIRDAAKQGKRPEDPSIATAADVPPDPTRPVVQVSSETTTEPNGNAPKPPPAPPQPRG